MIIVTIECHREKFTTSSAMMAVIKDRIHELFMTHTGIKIRPGMVQLKIVHFGNSDMEVPQIQVTVKSNISHGQPWTSRAQLLQAFGQLVLNHLLGAGFGHRRVDAANRATDQSEEFKFMVMLEAGSTYAGLIADVFTQQIVDAWECDLKTGLSLS